VMDSGLGAKRRPGMTEEARLGMTMVDSLPLSRDSLRPSFAIDVLPPWLGGRRESRAQDAPAAPCARNGSTRVSSPQVHRKRSGFPCTMVYGLFRALPGDRLVCHRRLRVTRRLDASIGASGPHGFAVRAGLVRRSIPLASIASRANVSWTTMIRPSRRRGTAGQMPLIWGR